MIRRSFRFGLLLGLAGGIVFALVKTLGGRAGSPTDEASPATRGDAWPPLTPTRPAPAPVVTPPVATPAPVRPEPAPVEPEPDPVVATPVVGEPPPPPAAEQAPAKQAPAKQAPAKPATKKAAARKAPAKKKASGRAWVEPTDGTCPTSHPVKAKLASKIFHLPGMLNYERTNPDRCYRDPDAATDDGLRPAKR